MKRIAGVVFASLVAAGAAQAEFVRPITSPTLVDSPDTGFTIHPIVIHQALPDQVNTELGNLPVGGDFQVYAVQLEYAFNQNLSLIAVKDGYIDFNPDDTFSEETGWADLAAGLKYVFHRSQDTVASVKLVAELPTGDDEAWQGNGDGAIDPAVASCSCRARSATSRPSTTSAARSCMTAGTPPTRSRKACPRSSS